MLSLRSIQSQPMANFLAVTGGRIVVFRAGHLVRVATTAVGIAEVPMVTMSKLLTEQ